MEYFRFLFFFSFFSFPSFLLHFVVVGSDVNIYTLNVKNTHNNAYLDSHYKGLVAFGKGKKKKVFFYLYTKQTDSNQNEWRQEKKKWKRSSKRVPLNCIVSQASKLYMYNVYSIQTKRRKHKEIVWHTNTCSCYDWVDITEQERKKRKKEKKTIHDVYKFCRRKWKAKKKISNVRIIFSAFSRLIRLYILRLPLLVATRTGL